MLEFSEFNCKMSKFYGFLYKIVKNLAFLIRKLSELEYVIIL